MDPQRTPNQRPPFQHPARLPMQPGLQPRHQGGRGSHAGHRHKKNRSMQAGNRHIQPWMMPLLPEPQQMHPGNRHMYMGPQPIQNQQLLGSSRNVNLGYQTMYPGSQHMHPGNQQQAQWLPPLIPRLRQMSTSPRHSGNRTRNPTSLTKEAKKESPEQKTTVGGTKVAKEEELPSPQEGGKPCTSVGQQVEDVQQRLDNISKSNSENLGLIQMLVAMQTATHQKIAQDTADMQNDTVTMQQDLLRKVAEIKQDQLLRQQRLMAELQAVREKTSQISLDHVRVSDQEVRLTLENVKSQPDAEVASNRASLIQAS